MIGQRYLPYSVLVNSTLSRRKGFSKNALKDALAAEGIAYQHEHQPYTLKQRANTTHNPGY